MEVEMIGVVIASHGELAGTLLKSAELLVGKQTNVKTCGLNYGDDISRFGEILGNYIDEVDRGDGVVVLTDIFGGSPCNRAIMHLRNKSFFCVSGVNLPMLIDVFLGRETLGMNAENLYNRCYESAIEGIKKVNGILK
jgi:PTS system mannose-specific IIA component